MIAIITRQNDDGSFDNDGIDNRRTTKEYFSGETLFRYGLKFVKEIWPEDTLVRIEMFRNELADRPAGTMYARVGGKRGVYNVRAGMESV